MSIVRRSDRGAPEQTRQASYYTGSRPLRSACAEFPFVCVKHSRTAHLKPHSDITDQRVVKALAHPLRIRILGILEQRTASPNEIAQEIGAPLGNVSYHVRKLAALDLIKLVKETPRRGAVEHHYRAEARPHITDEGWGKVPEIVKQAMVGAMLAQIGQRVNDAAAAGGFSRADAHISRTPIVLDERGWKAMAQELKAVLDRIARIQAQSEKRLVKRDHRGEIEGAVVMMLFEAASTPHQATGLRGSRSQEPSLRK